jgi:hypothetical protein
VSILQSDPGLMWDTIERGHTSIVVDVNETLLDPLF